MDLRNIFEERVKIADKDIRRMVMFEAACLKRAAEITQENPAFLALFVEQSVTLHARWLGRAFDVVKAPWLAWFGRDPFKSERDSARAFAKEWRLDPEFIQEMG